MAAKKPKFYVVWKGVKPGVYTTWEETHRQVSGFPGAEYKSFGTLADANAAFAGAYSAYKGKPTRAVLLTPAALEALGVDLDAMAVDAACAGVPGPMEYRGVWVRSGEEAFHAGPLDEGTNNVGEFLAIVHALALLQRLNRHHTTIYSDSVNAHLWVEAKQCRTKLERTSRNERIFELIARAEAWLRSNTWQNPVRKWDTANWGEIPADFGRK
jgi:ribonuclease HI